MWLTPSLSLPPSSQLPSCSSRSPWRNTFSRVYRVTDEATSLFQHALASQLGLLQLNTARQAASRTAVNSAALEGGSPRPEHTPPGPCTACPGACREVGRAVRLLLRPPVLSDEACPHNLVYPERLPQSACPQNTGAGACVCAPWENTTAGGLESENDEAGPRGPIARVCELAYLLNLGVTADFPQRERSLTVPATVTVPVPPFLVWSLCLKNASVSGL